MTDLAQPTAIRRTVAFSSAALRGILRWKALRRGLRQRQNVRSKSFQTGRNPVLADKTPSACPFLNPVLWSHLAKRNTGTKITMRDLSSHGPGFTAGVD